MAVIIPVTKIAFIGAGPRGLGALEELVRQHPQDHGILELTVFDDLLVMGAGPNFDPAQTPHSLLNVPIREVEIDPVLDLPCRGFEDWQKQKSLLDEDCFPSRSSLGAYLMQRFRDVATFADGFLSLTAHKSHVTDLHRDGEGWYVISGSDRFGPFDEVLLVLGQPQTEPDEQWQAWCDHADMSDAVCLQAYPDRKLVAASKSWTSRKVGIRGMGLSTYDVLRCLTVGQGGAFEEGKYIKSGAEPERIFMFSLNGQPPFPKPNDAVFDARFSLLQTESDQFKIAVQEAVKLGPEAALKRICDAVVVPAMRIAKNLGSTCGQAEIDEWLSAERSSPGAQETLEPESTLKLGIDMATGRVPPTAGYVIGQMWRKMQNELRTGFNSADVAPDTAKALVGFDESLKRYSYGPPLGSAQELSALVDCGLVSMSIVDDPDITQVSNGWRLIEGDTETSVSVMINAVIAPPVMEAITDPVIKGLRLGGCLQESYAGSGVKTAPDGQVVSTSGEVAAGLCLLGRLALGSVIAVDSIHDCFGASSQRWAQGVLNRSLNRCHR